MSNLPENVAAAVAVGVALLWVAVVIAEAMARLAG